MDRASSSSDGEILIYHYTLINWTASQLSAADMQRMKETVINQTCENQDKTLLKNGITLEFRYKSKDGSPVQDFRIAPKKCIFDPFAKRYGLAP